MIAMLEMLLLHPTPSSASQKTPFVDSPKEEKTRIAFDPFGFANVATDGWQINEKAQSCSTRIGDYEIGEGGRHQINLLHHWTFPLGVYCCHKSVFVHLSIANARDFPKRDLIASIQLGRLGAIRCRRAHSVALRRRPLPSHTNCPSCSQRSTLRDHRCGNCGKAKIYMLLLHKLGLWSPHLSAIWCQRKSNKFNLTANISEADSFSWTTFMPLSIRLMVRLDCLLSERSDTRCWLSSSGECLLTYIDMKKGKKCLKEKFLTAWEVFLSFSRVRLNRECSFITVPWF